MKNLFLAATLIFLSYPSLASTVGNGADGVQTDEGYFSIDALQYADEFDPQELEAFKGFIQDRLKELGEKLPHTTAFIRKTFEKAPPRWYFADYELEEIDDEGQLPSGITSMDKVQVAINTGPEVYVQKKIFNDLEILHQAFVLMHEAVWSMIEGSGIKLGDKVRKISGRVLSKYNYRLQPKELITELLEIVGSKESPFREALILDLRDLKTVDSGINEDASPLQGFLHFCVKAVDKELDEVQSMARVLNIPSRYFYSRQECGLIYRHFFNKTEIVIPNKGAFFVKSIVPYTFFPKLKSLSVYALTDDFESLHLLSKLPELETLVITRSKLRDLSFLQDLNNIKDLRLEQNEIQTGLSHLDHLDLETLILSRNFLDDAELQHLDRQTNLKVLDLSGNLISSLHDLKILQSPQLRELYLRDLGLDSARLPPLGPNLLFLSLENNRFTEVPDLSDSSSIETLNLISNFISSASFLPKLTNLTGVDLSKNAFTEWHFALVSPSVEFISLRDNQIHSIHPPEGALPHLHKLGLAQNQITSTDFFKGDAFSHLRHLHLSNNQLVQIEPLSDLRQLQFLKLANNQIESIEALSSLKYLVELDISGNQPLFSVQKTYYPDRDHSRHYRKDDYVLVTEYLERLGSVLQDKQNLRTLRISDSIRAPSINHFDRKSTHEFKRIEGRRPFYILNPATILYREIERKPKPPLFDLVKPHLDHWKHLISLEVEMVSGD